MASGAAAACGSPTPKQRSKRKRVKVVTPPPIPHIDINPRIALWTPPVSPLGLIEEELYSDPWRLLVACMLLNVTSAKVVRTVIWRLFELHPSPESLAEVTDFAPLEQLLRPLGLFRKRAKMLSRFSREYLETEWTDPRQLHGIGQYAADAYFMFCRGLWRDVQPQDKDLLAYRNWLLATDGLGSGLER